MSDEEEESLSEGFSASEDEWKPSDKRGGESSDDDDSEFEEVAAAPATSGSKAKNRTGISLSRKREPKGQSSVKQTALAKKKKPAGQSLRTKLYNKYRPPPKTVTSPTLSAGSNSPSASTSRTAPKNLKAPNESSEQRTDSSSESSVEDYLVDPTKLDFGSSFFDVGLNAAKQASPAPQFDCNAGIEHLSDSGSEDNRETSGDDESKSKAFDFRNLLEKANSLERAKEMIEKNNIAMQPEKPSHGSKARAAALEEVHSLLALGEKHTTYHTNDENHEDEDLDNENVNADGGKPKLSKTKSTRIKRHTKTRPASAVVANDTDDSDWEEVADGESTLTSANNSNVLDASGKLEIIVEMPSKQRRMQKQTDLELALKRKLNRDLKERQLMLHKATLLCCIARSYCYNKMINNRVLMQSSLKLLPSQNAYPPEQGTEIKYYQSLITWFKTAIKLKSQNLYPAKTEKSKKLLKQVLYAQIKQREARCKQDMVLIFIILMRGMGLRCRFVVNLKPVALKPAQEDLITIKLKDDARKDDANLDKSDGGSVGREREPTHKNQSQTAANESTEQRSKKVKAPKKEAVRGGDPKGEESHTKKVKSAVKVEKDVESLQSAKLEIKAELVKSEEHANIKLEIPINTAGLKSEQIEDHSVENMEENSKENIKQIVPPPVVRSKRGVALKKLQKAEPKAVEVAQEEKSNSRSPRRAKEPSAENAAIPRRTRKTLNNASLPQIVITKVNQIEEVPMDVSAPERMTRSRTRSQSPKLDSNAGNKTPTNRSNKNEKVKISPKFLTRPPGVTRVLRPRQTSKDSADKPKGEALPQLDGADDSMDGKQKKASKRLKLPKLKTESTEDSDGDFEPTPPKKPKAAPILPKTVQKLRKDRRVLSTDEEEGCNSKNVKDNKGSSTAADMWPEVWSDVEEQWVCVDLFKGKIHSVESIRKSASTLVYVFAFQNDLSIKDVSARYCANWATTLRRSRVDNAWLTAAIRDYFGIRTKHDILEDQELRRIHEEKPMPTTISEYKDHPLYALDRHLLKFQAIYPPDAPTLGFIRGEPVYSRDCVHTLHSRDIWLKQARTVKLGEEPYKVVKARPKWDRITQTVIKDQPLEIFGYWQTEDYDPPTAENGIVPRNAYGNVELFKACMLPKKTVHIRLPGLNRICKKLGIDCANAVVGFDFHQGACHPTYDGFVVCEEFADQVTAAWYQDQEEQERKEQEKYEARVYGNWKKLIRGLLIKERLKKKYNF